MEEQILPTKRALAEALQLSSEILRNIELSEVPLENIALKTGRLARLLNDFEIQEIIRYEVGGYPVSINGLHPDIYKLAVTAGREYEKLETKPKTSTEPATTITKKYVYTMPVNQMESDIWLGEASLVAAKDSDISLSSSNPNQHVGFGVQFGNAAERNKIRSSIADASKRLSACRCFIYHYVLKKHFELQFSGIADDVFTRIRLRVDSSIGNLLPDSVKKFNAVYDNLQSENSEDWSNAVHSCRRILQDLADVIFPAIDESRVKAGKKINLGKDSYINRIMCFVEDSSNSERFQHLVGSHLEFLGERLDSIFKASQKGSHANILAREEADRYVAYTYLVVGDILTLWNESRLV